MKFLSSELLAKTRVENVADMIGKISISIGGISVNDSGHVIDLGESKSVEVIIGDDIHSVEITEADDSDMSEGLKALRTAEVEAIEAAEKEAEENKSQDLMGA